MCATRQESIRILSFLSDITLFYMSLYILIKIGLILYSHISNGPLKWPIEHLSDSVTVAFHISLSLFTIHQNVVIFKSETALTTIGHQYFVQSDWLKRTCANVAIFSVHHFMMFTIIFLDNPLTQN